VVGKPFLYATTKEFLLHFGLQSLDDLPPLEDFEDALSEGGASFATTIPEPDREELFEQEALRAEREDEDEDDDEDGAPQDVAESEELGEEATGETGDGIAVGVADERRSS
jgi:segregation and condensation protein B